jgi:hypothetical protein
MSRACFQNALSDNRLAASAARRGLAGGSAEAAPGTQKSATSVAAKRIANV